MSGIIALSRADLAGLMQFGDYVEAVADAFRLHTEGRAVLPPAMEIRAEGGAFHVKAARLGDYVAVKTNSNFPDNPRRGLPTIQGAILLFEAGGALLAVVDSIEITIKRTGAATAVAARYLARPDSRVATICGCGAQARVQLEALCHGLDIRRVFAVDGNPSAADKFAAEMTALGLDPEVPATLRDATLQSDIIVTCTTAHVPYLGVADVRPGTFIAAIGADNPEKSEIEPALMAQARVVTDVREQCAVMGDLHHALRARTMTQADVHAELGELVAGRRPGRAAADDIMIFDGCGLGIQDAAAAGRAYERARERGVGVRIGL
ncbi:MAG: ornithine cyclodeaminase family protein [Alphaproteobacteria bacterium]|nr:MAG: ornithine cyclodeaminase family protein [Alphaproteobacteria bacterium]